MTEDEKQERYHQDYIDSWNRGDGYGPLIAAIQEGTGLSRLEALQYMAFERMAQVSAQLYSLHMALSNPDDQDFKDQMRRLAKKQLDAMEEGEGWKPPE